MARHPHADPAPPASAAVWSGVPTRPRGRGRLRGVALLAASTLPCTAQSPFDAACPLRWEMRGERLTQVVFTPEDATHRFDPSPAAAVPALLDALRHPETFGSTLIGVLALASGGGPFGDVDGAARRTGLDPRLLARWERLEALADGGRAQFPTWTPWDAVTCLVEAVRHPSLLDVLDPELRAGLAAWRSPRAPDARRERRPVLPVDHDPLLCVEIADPTAVDAVHAALVRVIAETTRRAVLAQGRSLSPAQRTELQNAAERARAWSWSFADALGCWRLHGLAVGRRGATGRISICAEVDLRRVAALARDRGVLVAPDLEPPTPPDFVRLRSGEWEAVIAPTAAALGRGWATPCAPPAAAPRDEAGLTFTFWQRADAPVGLGAFEVLTCEAAADERASLLVRFTSAEQRRAWLEALDDQRARFEARRGLLGELPAAQSVADPIGHRFVGTSLRDVLTVVFVDPDD